MTADRFANYRHLLGSDQFDQLKQACARPLPDALRVNTLTIDLDTARHVAMVSCHEAVCASPGEASQCPNS